MGNFNRDRGGDRGGYRGGSSRGGSFNRRDSGRDSRGGYDREKPEMHKAVCADCGKSCEVPFRPSSDKPVYCRDCFDKRNDREDGNDRGNRRSDYGDRGDRGGREEKRMFPAVCDSCGKRCEVPFRPSGDKPIYCSDCFGHKDEIQNNMDSDVVAELKAQINTINTKLDRVLRALELRGQIGPVEEIVIKTEPEEVISDIITVETKEKPKKVVKKKAVAKKKPTAGKTK